MAKLPVQVTGDGTLDFSRTTNAYRQMASASSNGCQDTKQRASDIADEWDERARRCEKVGTQTEEIRGTTVVMDLQACETNAALWRLLTEHLHFEGGEEGVPKGIYSPGIDYHGQAKCG